jgi:hypothetical protein
MRRIVTLITTALGLTTFSAACWLQPSSAQGYPTGEPTRRIEGLIMGGLSPTAGETASLLQDGWIVDGGFIYWLGHSGTLGLRTDIGYSEHQATDQFLTSGERATGQRVDDGWGSFSSFSTGLILRAPPRIWPRVYGIAQVGVTNTHVRLVQTFYVPGYYCDPFFYYCSYPIVGYASVYSHTTNRFSWNIGIGLDFPTQGIAGWFVELQYRRVESSPQAFEYWPVMVGLRF